MAGATVSSCGADCTIVSVTTDPTTWFSGYAAGFELSSASFVLPSFPANGGGHIEVQLNLTNPLTVPGSQISNGFIVSLGDGSVAGFPPPGSQIATTHFTFPTTPAPTLDFNGVTSGIEGGYYAIAAQAAPSNGFTVQASRGSPSADITFDIDPSGGDPLPLDELTLVSETQLPGPPQVLSGLQGGTPSNPTLLPSGTVASISGSISGPNPSTDYYTFNWGGGDFEATAGILNAPSAATFQYVLTGPQGQVLKSDTISGPGFLDTLFYAGLSAGRYVIGLSVVGGNDPDYTVTFNTPVSGVPEPGAWAMMLIGLGAMGAVMRRPRGRAGA